MTGYIVIFVVSLTGFEEQVETLRDLSSVPASARNKVVFPHPGGPSNKVSLRLKWAYLASK